MSAWQKVKQDCAALSLSCREAARAQSDQLEAPLPAARRFGLFLHLLICKWCRRYGRQLRFLRQSAHTHADTLAEASPQSLSNTARERMKLRLRNEK